MNRHQLEYEASQPANGTIRNHGFIALVLSVTSVLCFCGAAMLYNGTVLRSNAGFAADVTGLLTLVSSFVFSSLALRGRGRGRAMGICALTLASVWSVVLFVLLFG